MLVEHTPGTYNTMNKLIILSGIPGSGKSTYAADYVEQNPDTVIIGRDKLRELLFGYTEANVQTYYANPLYKEREETVTTFQHIAIRAGLSNGKSVIIDDTNCSYTRILNFYNTYKMAFEVEVKFFDTPLSDCIGRNALRARQVGIDVITQFHDRFQYAKTEWEANQNREKVDLNRLDEKGFVFLSPNKDKPYLIRMWGGEPWLFFWSADNRWVSARTVKQTEVWAAVESRLPDEQAEHYHKLNDRPL